MAGGGFHPEHSLPIVLDVGCNRKEMLEDRFYMVRAPGSRACWAPSCRAPRTALSSFCCCCPAHGLLAPLVLCSVGHSHPWPAYEGKPCQDLGCSAPEPAAHACHCLRAAGVAIPIPAERGPSRVAPPCRLHPLPALCRASAGPGWRAMNTMVGGEVLARPVAAPAAAPLVRLCLLIWFFCVALPTQLVSLLCLQELLTSFAKPSRRSGQMRCCRRARMFSGCKGGVPAAEVDLGLHMRRHAVHPIPRRTCTPEAPWSLLLHRLRPLLL